MSRGVTAIALISLGCDKNLVESEAMLGALASLGDGYAFTADEEEADVIIVNTCGFIKDAVREGAERIREALAIKEAGRGGDKRVIVTGCMAQRYGEKLYSDFPGIDAVARDVSQVAALVSAGAAPAALSYRKRILSTPGHYAYLKIAEGCDNRCAYCAIPLIKGSYKSRPANEILDEARALAAGGVKELILVAQDTALYGSDIHGKSVIHELLRALSEVSGVEWIRLLYCYPEHITGELIDEMSKNPKVCHYIDMPMQHSSTAVLQRMGRRNDENALRDLISRLRAAMPDAALRTTVITGFPGETREDFQNLLAFIDDVKFDKLGAFAYSREEGTPAYDFTGQITEKTREARRSRVMERQLAISETKLKGFVGRIMKVITDGYDSIEKIYYGRSYMDAPEIDGAVLFKADKGRINQGDFAEVIITESAEYDLYGKLC